jgi:hypothetical protein
VLVCKAQITNRWIAFVLDSFVETRRPCRAGDALLAYSTLAMLATKDPTQATIIGLLAAACECECDGNAHRAQANFEKAGCGGKTNELRIAP